LIDLEFSHGKEYSMIFLLTIFLIESGSSETDNSAKNTAATKLTPKDGKKKEKGRKFLYLIYCS